MGHTKDLLVGLATDAAAAGIGLYHDSVYAVSDIGIGVGKTPQTCDQAIGITDYLTASDSPNQALGQIGVQFEFRGLPDDKTSMTDLADAVFQLFHGMVHRQYGACHVIQMLRKSSIPLGQDAAQRFERTDNYLLDVNVPVTANRA
jgi:hypothetical protein